MKKNTISKTVTKALELQEQGNIPEAIKLFRKSLLTSPADWISLFSLAHILVYQDKPEEALKLLDRLVAINPQYVPGFYLRGIALEKLGRHEQALIAVDKGLRLDPGNVDALNRRGALLKTLTRDNEAILCYQKVLTFEPNHQMTLSNLGKLLFLNKRYHEARVTFEHLVSLNPDYQFARGWFAFNKLHEANWEGLAEIISCINAEIRSGKASCPSLAFMAISDSARDQFQCARIFSGSTNRPAQQSVWKGEQYRHEKIRIAYISGDFLEHPVSHLIAGVFERHDKSQFETIALSLGVDDKSMLRSRIIASVDKFLDVRLMGFPELSKLIGQLEVDIAVDLSGFTQNSLNELFSKRIAPVQVNFLGYPGTMGADYMDYILADPHVIPEAEYIYYDEKVACLPDTYLPTDSKLSVSPLTLSRAEAGLPSSGFVFCSFNHIFKINPQMFDIWMGLLSEVSGSVLWLSKPTPEALLNLRLEAKRRGVDPQRLIFAERTPLVEDHLARYRLADIFLDTNPYNAHTTAADALFVGLPVISCKGNSFPGRVASSLLNALGMPELVTGSLEQYAQLALALAQDPERLAALKVKLKENKARFPLFDTERYCRHLESAFTTMHETYQQGKSPASFVVKRLAGNSVNNEAY